MAFDPFRPTVGLDPALVNAPPDDALNIGITALDSGGVVVDIGTRRNARERRKDSFGDNLAEDLSEGTLGAISTELLQGIQADEQSISAWIDNYNRGMDFLGLIIQDRSTSQNRKNVSTVVHPLMQWAIVNFQSLARAELYPAAGPCKVKNDAKGTAVTNEAAQGIERRMNHYLTSTAVEYYPDSDRGLFYLGYGGTIFKKVYRCSLRSRPVSECVYMPDLIVSNDATDLTSATRVTHRINMTKSQLRRMQLEGAYLDIDVAEPRLDPSPVQQKEGQLTGRQPAPERPADQPYTILECHCEIDLTEHGIDEKGQPKDFPLPYCVVIDKDSQKVLSVTRDWKEGDKKFKRRKWFVKFGMVPAIGFLDLGYLHLLGNHTRALTGIWRIMIDAGMFASFPSGVRVKGTRISTNEISPGPGEWPEVDIGPLDDINKAFMRLPYSGPNAELLSLAQGLEDEGKQMAGTVQLEVGEGRANVPVGTVMALIEQQTKVMAAVHKRLHAAQQEELTLLKDLLAEDPECLLDEDEEGSDVRDATIEKLKQELANNKLVPASDPNVPAQMQRIMQGTALAGRAKENPDMYNRFEVEKRLLKLINQDDVETLIHEPTPQPQGDGGDPNQAALTQLAMMEQRVQMERVQIDKQKVAMQAGQAERDHVKWQQDTAVKMAQLQLDAVRLQADIADKAVTQETRQRTALLQEETKRLGHILDALGKHSQEMNRHADGTPQPGLSVRPGRSKPVTGGGNNPRQ